MPSGEVVAASNRYRKLMRDALMLAINREVAVDGRVMRRIDAMCDALIDKAISGDVEAFKVIADRVEGKVAQPVGGSDDLPPTRMTFSWQNASDN